MTPDPIVDEIHRIREAHAAKFNFDLRAIFLDLQERQSHSGRKYVSFDPQKCVATMPREPADVVPSETEAATQTVRAERLQSFPSKS